MIADLPPIAPKPIVRVVRSTFRPWAQPTPAEVRIIAHVEARRTGASVSSLLRRINCESTMRWWATNGRYIGLGQFHSSTFYRGMASLDTRRVTVRKVRWRVRGPRDGRRWREKTVHLKTGLIPANPPVSHGWAQVRVMSLALVGRSAVRSSEWACAA